LSREVRLVLSVVWNLIEQDALPEIFRQERRDEVRRVGAGQKIRSNELRSSAFASC
jgi:hypothetical protein